MEQPVRDDTTLGALSAGARPDDELDAAHALARVRRAMFGRGSGGIQLSRYLLQERLGSGGEGAVYAAHDPELGRRVAVKLLSRGDSGREVHERLLKEARTLAAINHPNVVSVYDAGEYDLEEEGMGRGVFTVMELLQGDTVDAWVASQTPPLSALLDAFVQAARGLQAVHEAGLVHRDIKPQNILVSTTGRVVIADFGVAEYGESTDHVMDSQRLDAHESGTPRYMSPEQRAGRPPNARGDQWSFCATLWAAIFGAPPPHPENLKDKAPPGGFPDTPRVPRHVRRVLMRGLSPNPTARYPSMAALIDRLDRRRVQRRRTYQLIAGGGLVGVGLALVASLTGSPRCEDASALLKEAWNPARANRIEAITTPELRTTLDDYATKWIRARKQSCRDSRARDEATRRKSAAGLACLERGLRSFRVTVDVLLDPHPAVMASADNLVARLPDHTQCLENPPAVLNPPSPTPPEISAALFRTSIISSAGEHDEALDLLNEMDPRDLTPSSAARWHGVRSRIHMRRGETAKAEADMYEASRMAVEGGDEDFAVRVLIDLAHAVGQESSRLGEASRILAQAAARTEAANLGADTRASLHLEEGNLRISADEFEEAREKFETVRKICEEGKCRNTKLIASALNGLGSLHYSQGRYEEARSHFLQHLSRSTDSHGVPTTTAWPSLFNLGLVAMDTGRHEEARAWFLRAEDVAGNRSAWRFHYGHAMLAAREDDLDAADRHLDAASAALARSAPRSMWALDLEVMRARVASLRGNPKVAYERLVAVRDQAQREYGAAHERTRDTLEEMGITAAAMGNTQACVDHHRHVLELRRAHLTSPHPYLARSQHELGRCLLRQGKVEEAHRLLRLAERTWVDAVGPFAPRSLDMERDLARAEWWSGLSAQAQDRVERALALMPDTQAPEHHRADLEFALAQIVERQDPARALALALDAHATYDRLGPRYRRASEEIQAWISNPPDRGSPAAAPTAP